MRPAILIAALAALTAALPAAAMNPEARPQGEAMILGTYHFEGSASDLVSRADDNILAPGPQADLEAITDRLAQWAPDKIMIEATPDRQAEFDTAYRAYLEGEAALTGNERQQLAFRLAKKLGHERIYAVDHKADMDFDAMTGAMDAAGQTELKAHFEASVAGLRALLESPEWTEMGVAGRLALMNDPEWLNQSHGLYLDMAEAGSADNPVGADEMSEWWGRNLHIYANAARLAEDGDRILLVYGSGHAYTLRHYFEHSARFKLIEPAPYLTPAQ
ncbi:MAG: hypothetical protein H2040_13390 [Euryhalocaulis sp.]|uniref:DUF5694 domain-containing protein n=1 Tax=Euryhalocaulis sp. TaxID=2744307 RepID=UPI0018076DCF|nr:DUF5694 domain-containing protein [Euryhalocaulis sp.]MBA4802847.1 hypothetical protein [Euryhalocaulis sp.]